jgi:hypothetical protein
LSDGEGWWQECAGDQDEVCKLSADGHSGLRGWRQGFVSRIVHVSVRDVKRNSWLRC